MRAKRSATRARSSKRSETAQTSLTDEPHRVTGKQRTNRRGQLEHERRALYQSDARYWRERYESIASAPVVRSHRFHRASTPSARTPGSRWPSPRDYPKRRPRRRFAPFRVGSRRRPIHRTSPFLPSRRTHHHRPIAPTPSIEAWRTLHLTIVARVEEALVYLR